MPLESLLQLVETLRNRIGGHRAALSSNEMLTRYALVDPLLCELGWDTADPAIVIPEDTSGLGRGRPDYVLQNNEQPAMVIEAKKLGSGLQNGARQAIDYAMDANRQARYFAITDGQHWEIYDTNRPASDMRAATFDILAASPGEVCLKAMALWRPAVEHGSVMAAEKPIVGLDDIPQLIATARVAEETIEPPESIVSDAPTPSPRVHNAPPEKPSLLNQKDEMPADGWIPLSQLHTQKGDKVPSNSEILFPDNTRTRITSWRGIFVETIQWLQDNHKLDANMCPIPITEERYIVAAEAVHQRGNKFTEPKRIGNLYAEVNYNGPDIVEKARFVIMHIGQDPAQFKVRLS